MKLKAISVLLFFLMLVSLVPMSVSAAQEPAFLFDLSVNSETSVEADAGDVLLITLMLKRTDSGDVYTMHGMQSEISYDSSQFELVENSIQLGTGVQSTVVDQVDNSKEIYLNYLSLFGGEQWDAETFIGSFQLKVLTATGVGEITNHDYMVSRPDGSGSYVCEGNTVSVVLSTDCTVQFSPNGGTAVPEQQVFFGEKIQKPEDPSRDGYQFVGWYSDIHLQNPWDFENDTVSKSIICEVGRRNSGRTC